MKRYMKTAATTLCGLGFGLLLASGVRAEYKSTAEHQGGDVTPTQAAEMLKKDPEHTFLVDVRTQMEYEYVGHPTTSVNVPFRLWNVSKFNPEKKEYVKDVNPNFGKDLLARFNPATDTLIIMCRSGHRSPPASTEAVKAGFSAEKVFNLMGGFEGALANDRRNVDGWRNENLPWTYAIDQKLIYGADTVAAAAAPAPAAK